MRWMGWSWQELNDCPASIVETVIVMIEEQEPDDNYGG